MRPACAFSRTRCPHMFLLHPVHPLLASSVPHASSCYVSYFPPDASFILNHPFLPMRGDAVEQRQPSRSFLEPQVAMKSKNRRKRSVIYVIYRRVTDNKDNFPDALLRPLAIHPNHRSKKSCALSATFHIISSFGTLPMYTPVEPWHGGHKRRQQH